MTFCSTARYTPGVCACRAWRYHTASANESFFAPCPSSCVCTCDRRRAPACAPTSFRIQKHASANKPYHRMPTHQPSFATRKTIKLHDLFVGQSAFAHLAALHGCFGVARHLDHHKVVASQIHGAPAMTPIDIIYAHTFKTMSAEVTESLVRSPPATRGQIEEASSREKKDSRRKSTHCFYNTALPRAGCKSVNSVYPKFNYQGWCGCSSRACVCWNSVPVPLVFYLPLSAA